MIRVFEVMCKNEFNYCKRKFKIGEVYKAYVNQDGGYIVFNDRQRVLFDDRRAGQLKSENFTKNFKENFEVITTDIIRNKKELNEYLTKQ